VGWLWWGVALFFSGLLLLIAIVINVTFLGGEMPGFAFFREGWYWAPAYFALTIIGGPLGEEFGWRGFALPNLQRKFNPTVATIILGTLWGLWHLPLFFQAGSLHAQIGLQMLPVYVLGEIVLATFITWVYNSTGGSLLVGGIILHNADNFWASVLITDETMASAFQGGVQSQFDMQLYLVAMATGALAAIAIAVATKWRLGLGK
jgi:membrane protease YdiL (CAAX protease family)